MIRVVHPIIVNHHSLPNSKLMSRNIITRMAILAYLVLISYAVAQSIQTGSVTALALSIVSLGAGVYFFYLLSKIREQG